MCVNVRLCNKSEHSFLILQERPVCCVDMSHQDEKKGIVKFLQLTIIVPVSLTVSNPDKNVCLNVQK